MKRDRIENAIRHIQTAVDIDPWACDLAVEALKAQLSEEDTTSDCISRQAAIDLWEQYHPYIAIKACEYDAKLRRLPSVQPEIIYCKDCKHYNAGFECLIEGYGIERNKNWYCADAERRNDG